MAHNFFHFTELRKIDVPGGQVYHGLKCTDQDFESFGEAYFSFIEKGAVKGWKLHRKMKCNLIVPIGRVVVNCYAPDGTFGHFDIGPDSQYGRLTIEPMTWFAFGGADQGENCLLNIANILHDPHESDKQDIKNLIWKW